VPIRKRTKVSPGLGFCHSSIARYSWVRRGCTKFGEEFHPAAHAKGWGLGGTKRVRGLDFLSFVVSHFTLLEDGELILPEDSVRVALCFGCVGNTRVVVVSIFTRHSQTWVLEWSVCSFEPFFSLVKKTNTGFVFADVFVSSCVAFVVRFFPPAGD